MAAPKSEFLSATGTSFQILKAIVDEVLALGGSDKDLRCLISDSAMRRRVALQIVPAPEPRAEPGSIFTLHINPILTTEEWIAAGNYDWWNRDIIRYRREDKPIYTGVDPVSVKAELLHFDRDISTDDALAEIDRRGYCPANFEGLAAFGAENPEVQREFPIVALGSVFVGPDGGRCSPCLDVDRTSRHLYLDWRDDDWLRYCRWLVFRKDAGKLDSQ